MESINTMIQIPSWAYDFCYYYFAVAVLIALFSIYAIVQLFLMPNSYRRVIPFVSTVIAMSLSSIISVVLALMQFWVCRAALKPTSVPAKIAVQSQQQNMGMGMGMGMGRMNEPFADACKTPGDCTAISGTPQTSGMCVCGGRGVCGGCTMQNNMEPQAEFAAAFAPF